MKKYSWIVALVLALSLSALFISCGADPIISEPPAGVTYTEVLLNNGMNIWAGGKDQQQGWATGAGFKFLGVGDKLESAKDAGYVADDFKAAEFLVLELQPGAPKGGVQLIWGAAEGNAQNISGWNSQKLTSDSGEVDASKGVTVEKGEEGKGDTWKIELKKALANYGQYKNAEEVKILLQYYTGKGVADLYVANSGKLLIPDVEVPFVEVKSITLASNVLYWTDEIQLKGTITPEDATEQVIIWSIKSWTPKGATLASQTLKVTGNPKTPAVLDKDENGNNIAGSSYNLSKAALTGKVDFKPTKVTVLDPIIETDYSVVPPIDITYFPGLDSGSSWGDHWDDSWNTGTHGVIDPEELNPFYPVKGTKSKDTLIATDNFNSNGTVVIQALVIGGLKDGKDYTTEFSITITDPPPFSVKVDTTSQDVVYYKPLGDGATIEAAADKSGFTYKAPKQNYQGNTASFRVALGSGKKLSDFDKVTFTFEGKKGDVKNKPLQLWARSTAITSPIWSGQPIVGQQNTTQNDPNGQYVDGKKDLAIFIGSSGDTSGWNQGNSANIASNIAAADAAGDTLWFVIYLGGSTDSTANFPDPSVEFTITNIVFVPK